MPSIRAIYRYPVKGLSPEPLERVALAPGLTLPNDRLYAIENGPSGFNAAHPAHLPKQRFLMLMRNARLAALRTRFEDANHILTIVSPAADGGAERAPPAVAADLRTPDGRAAVEQFFTSYCADELRGPPKILRAEGHSFSDVARKVVSIINLASVAAVEDMVGVRLDPLRFRGNVYMDGLPAWRELELVGSEMTIAPQHEGGKTARLKIVKRITRCAATNVDPARGIADLDIPRALMRALGHADCGVYAEVIAGGAIAVGDRLEVAR